MDRLYFAYGSNMNPVQMRFRCPTSKAVARATLSGYRFAINTRGDEEVLDCFEGVRSGAYVKRRITLSLGGKRRNALVYVGSDSERGLPRAGYLERIIRGAEYFKLGREYISQLERLAYA